MNDRQKQMEQFIFEEKEVSMYDLVEKFDVSMNTVRADVRVLEERSTVEKIYGGVKSTLVESLTAFDIRRTKKLDEKKRIASVASKYIEKNDVIFVDSGTTLMYILEGVPADVSLTVITHNYNVITSAIEMPNITIISLPGTFDRKTRSYFDITTTEILRKYNINKAFLAATTVSKNGNLCNNNYVESDIKRTALEISIESYLLIDSSKFGLSSLMTYGSLSDIDILITDENIPESIMNLTENLNVKVEIA